MSQELYKIVGNLFYVRIYNQKYKNFKQNFSKLFLKHLRHQWKNLKKIKRDECPGIYKLVGDFQRIAICL